MARAGASHGQIWPGLGAAGAEGSRDTQPSRGPSTAPSLCTLPSAPGYMAAGISQGIGSLSSLPTCQGGN